MVTVSPQSCHVGRKAEQHGYCMGGWVGTSWKQAVLSHGPNIPIPHTQWAGSKWALVLGQRVPHRAADNAGCELLLSECLVSQLISPIV